MPAREFTPGEIDIFVAAGRARWFNRSVRGMVPAAVKIDKQWYLRIEGEQNFTPAPTSAAALFDDFEARFAQADQAVAATDARTGG